MATVICAPRQNRSAYSAMMSARNHPNQTTGSIGEAANRTLTNPGGFAFVPFACCLVPSVARLRGYFLGNEGGSAWNHLR